MFARGKLLHLCSALVKALSSVQFCDQTLGRAQGLVGFRAQGLTGFHTQELVWFLFRNFWILFSEVSGILWPNHGASSSTGRSSIPWPLSWVQVRVFFPPWPRSQVKSGTACSFLGPLCPSIYSLDSILLTPWKWLLISLSVSYIQSQDCDSSSWWHRTWAGLRLL